MPSTGLKGALSRLGKFYAFAVPHWKMILLAVCTTVFYSALMASFIFVIDPVWKGLQTRVKRQAPSESGSASSAGIDTDNLGASSARFAASLDAVTRLEEKVKRRLSDFYPVRKIHQFIARGDRQLSNVGCLLLFLAPLVFIMVFLKTYAEGRVIWSIMADVRIALFTKLSHLPLAFYGKQRTGDLISRLTNDINTTQRALRMVFGNVLVAPIKLVFYSVVALLASWELTTIAMVILPLTTLVLKRYGARIRRYGRKTLEKLGDVTEAVSQLFHGIEVVKAFGMEEEEIHEFKQKNQAQLLRAFKLVRNRGWAAALPDLIYFVALASILILSSYLLSIGQIDVPELLMFSVAVVAMSGPVKRIVKSYNILQESLGAIDRLWDVLESRSELPEAPNAVELKDVRMGVRFEDVWFAYDRQPVLKGISLTVPRSSVCAIVGETGAGKSTLLRLLPRFYDPTSGAVKIDGIDIRNVKLDSLLGKMAIVGQHPFLFNRSIVENIRYGRRDASMEEIRAAARAANIDEFIGSLPDGYGTLVGEAGDKLSGGQRQCVTIARAILKNAPILILDEATSNLDSESELLVQRALANLMQDRTTLVIAHRLSTVRRADLIVVLKDGRIIEQGTHAELLARRGEYERLYRIQFGSAVTSADDGPSEG